jgi:hypothetical protein
MQASDAPASGSPQHLRGAAVLIIIMQLHAFLLLMQKPVRSNRVE